MDSVGISDPTDQFRFFATPQRRPRLPRACEECKRKKTKCDMRRPSCSLCHRIGIDCVYPKDRKRPSRRNTVVSQRPYSAAKVNGERHDSNILGCSFPMQSGQTQPGNLPSLPALLPPSPLIGRSSTNQQGLLDRTPDEGQSMLSGFDQLTPTGSFFDFSFSVGENDSHRLTNAAFTGMSPEGDQNPGFVLDHSKSLESYCFGESSSHELIGMNGTDGFNSTQFGNSGQIDILLLQSPDEIEPYRSDPPAAVNDQTLFSIDLPTRVGDHLVELYFEKVHCFLPLLHRPRFYAEFFQSTRNRKERYQQLDFETALLLNGMFALSARFSGWKDFWKSNPKERGKPFAEKAQALCDSARRAKGDDLTLRFLQGCIFLTYYQLASGPCLQAWLGVGTCCRMAYGLSLHQTDRQPTKTHQDTDGFAEEWANKEEQRRAWWTIVEMDNFGSITSTRPFNIDMDRMNVLLPVADEAWFSLRPVPSAPISTKGPSTVWSSLVNCQNQNEYAWYLVCQYFIRAAQEEFEKREHSVEDLKMLQSAIHCFALSLPSKFRMCAANMTFTEHNFPAKNWIISAHILLQSAKIFIALIFPDEDFQTRESNLQLSPSRNDNSPSSQLLCERSIERCGQHISDQLRAIHLWSPDFIPLATPLLTCALVGPAAVHAAEGRHGTVSNNMIRSSEGELLGLVLKRIAEYWDIGSLLQGLLQAHNLPATLSTPTAKRPEETWVQSMMPTMLYSALSSNLSSPT